MKQARLSVLLVGIIVMALVLWLKSFVVPYVTNLYIETNSQKLQDGTNKFVYQLGQGKEGLGFIYHYFKSSKIDYVSKDSSSSYLFFKSSLLESKIPPKSQSEINTQNKFSKSNMKENKDCAIIKDEDRFDCYPEDGVSQQNCEARGCCWRPPSSHNKPQNRVSKNDTLPPLNIPYCFYPKEFPGYKVDSVHNTKLGFMASLSRSTPAYYPNDIKQLVIDVRYETKTRLRFKIYDPAHSRYEVPLAVPNVSTRPFITSYSVNGIKTGKPFNMEVLRESPDASVPTVLMKTASAAPFIFADQFIQLSYFLPSNYIYGLGEHRDKLLHSTNWTRFTLWNKDQYPHENGNLYGSHPFYLMMENDGNSHGVFLLNSNAIDVLLQPSPAITWRTIGGIIDFYVFLGPSPNEVIQQYTEVIGRSFMPPYWSLGFHLCRWGYKTANGTLEVTNRNREVGIPQDVQWNDIDYMDEYKDFTISEAFGNQTALVNEIHNRGMHYIMIVDPGISNTQVNGTYKPYDLGMKMDIFVKDALTGKPIVGNVWPGDTVFPDFTNPASHEYWTTLVQDFHNKVPFDGMWIDMNEISSSVSGSISGCPDNSTLENPPYIPDVTGGSLRFSTLCATAKQFLSTQYNVHNLYGLTEANATYVALVKVRKKRPFIISRSTFAGQGQYGGHWTGDNRATYHDMASSVPAILSMNMFGIPMVGADICGFGGNTNEELCQRWQQLGAFYPFSRNHNNLGSMPQDPASFSQKMIFSTRRALEIRYSLLPYLYTLFHKSHMMGLTVVRPLFFEYPKDQNSYGIDKQFLWGQALMISPVLIQSTTQVDIYFPKDTWYNFYTGVKINKTGITQTLPAPMDTINLHMRGGYILPIQAPGLTTTDSRKNDFDLLVAYNSTNQAEGDMFFDDGDTLDTHEKRQFSMIHFVAEKNIVKSYVLHDGYKGLPTVLKDVQLYGLSKSPISVYYNGKSLKFLYDVKTQVLKISSVGANLVEPFSITWN